MESPIIYHREPTKTESMNTNKPIQQSPILWRLRNAEKRLILIIGDFAIAWIGLFTALYFWAQKDTWYNFSIQFLQERPPLWYYLLPIIWVLLLIELYDIKHASQKNKTIQGITIAAVIYLGLYLLIYFTSAPNSLPRQGVAVFIITTYILTILWRLLYIKIFNAPLFMRRVLIVGAGRAGSTLAGITKKMWPPPFYLVGLIDDDPDKTNTEISGFPVVGNCDEMLEIINRENITDIVFAISGEMNPIMFQALLTAEENGVAVTTMPVIYEELLGRVPISLLRSDWILRSFFDEVHAGEFYEMAKRIMDIAGGFVGATIMIVLTPLIALAILIDSGTPILYFQDRLGKNGKVYTIFKFRTMRQDAEKDGKARPASENDDRITKVGNILRKSHLDELPQFVNILRGDMSLVGPRAERLELVSDLQEKVPFYRARLLIKPGLTGWAQINFGYASTVEETSIKLEHDLYYIKHRNLLMDIVILIRTLGAVLGLKGQ